MINARDACVAADVSIPKALYDYFRDAPGEAAYIDLDYIDIGDMNSDGVEVTIENIPPEVIAIRVIYHY